MKDLLSFSKNEQKALWLGLLLLTVILLMSNIRTAYEGVSRLPVWQPKGRPAERSPNFKPPLGYQGVLNDLGTVRFVSLDVLVVVFKEIAGTGLPASDLAEVREGVHLAREFFWRNSNLQLNISPTFLEIDDPTPPDIVDDEGKLWPKSGLLEKDLLQRGAEKNQYDCVFVFYPSFAKASEGVATLRPAGVFGSGMKLKRLGKASYSFVSLPIIETNNAYPDGPPLTWMFARELWYSINTVIYGHDPEELGDWSSLATTLRQYPIQDPPKPYGKIYLTLDYDRDGVPDDEPLAPFDEGRLGLNRETSDSDNDGLSDMREITAGIFRGTDLFLKDTDGDGLKDGEDAHPLDSNLP